MNWNLLAGSLTARAVAAAAGHTELAAKLELLTTTTSPGRESLIPIKLSSSSSQRFAVREIPVEQLDFCPVFACTQCGFSPTGLVCDAQECGAELRVHKPDGAIVCPRGHGGINPVPLCCGQPMQVRPREPSYQHPSGGSARPYKCSAFAAFPLPSLLACLPGPFRRCNFGIDVGQMSCVGCGPLPSGTAFQQNHAIARIAFAYAYCCECRKNSQGGQIGMDEWKCICGAGSLSFPSMPNYFL